MVDRCKSRFLRLNRVSLHRYPMNPSNKNPRAADSAQAHAMKSDPSPYGPSFHTSRFEHELINKIANRAVALAMEYGTTYEKMTATMDVTACHANGCELELQKLLDAPEFDFAHDVFGIRRHIDRRTGKLGDCFLPRSAKAEGTS